MVSEGARYKNGEFLADAGTVDSFGHKQLGGVAPTVAEIVSKKLGLKYHWAVSDYLQRSARHISSLVMNFFGIFFSTFATLDNSILPTSQE